MNPALQTRLAIAQRAVRAGNPRGALAELDKLAAHLDNVPAYHETRLAACAKLNKKEEALASARRLVQLDPKTPARRIQFAIGLQQAGQPAQAVEQFDAALRRIPNDFEARRGKASALMDLGKYEQAGEILKALADSPDLFTLSPDQQVTFAISYARCAPKGTDPERAIDVLRSRLERDQGSQETRRRGWWYLARLYDQLGQVDLAMPAYATGHTLDRNAWDPDRFDRWIDALLASWDACEARPLPDVDGSRFVFVVGMMRSGTSLTEQMLAQASASVEHALRSPVTPAGESRAIPSVYKLIVPGTTPFEEPFPADTPARLTPELLSQMSERARGHYDEIASAGFVTDKQTFNYLSVPLISRILPGAKLIWCRRDLVDVGISNYTQHYRAPHPFVRDQTHLARYLRAYERVMLAWQARADVEMHELVYEDLVAEPERTGRAMFEFVGWPWTDDVMRFHESERVVQTASRDQVRQPLNTKSVGRSAKYGSHFDELRSALA